MVKETNSKTKFYKKKYVQKSILTRFTERETGIEPATFSLATRRSATELLPPGAGGGNRTHDLFFFRETLLPLSYSG